MAKKKKNKKRNYAKNEKYPALNPNRQVYNRREYHDMDYISQLSEKDKEYLHRFMAETLQSNFNHVGKTLYEAPEDRRKLFSENNARNRCMLSMAKSKLLLDNRSVEAVSEYINQTSGSSESELVDRLHRGRQRQEIMDLLGQLSDKDIKKLAKIADKKSPEELVALLKLRVQSQSEPQ